MKAEKPIHRDFTNTTEMGHVVFGTMVPPRADQDMFLFHSLGFIPAGHDERVLLPQGMTLTDEPEVSLCLAPRLEDMVHRNEGGMVREIEVFNIDFSFYHLIAITCLQCYADWVIEHGEEVKPAPVFKVIQGGKK